MTANREGKLVQRSYHTPVGLVVDFGIQIGDTVYEPRASAVSPLGISEAKKGWHEVSDKDRINYAMWEEKRGKWGDRARTIADIERRWDDIIAKGKTAQEHKKEQLASYESYMKRRAEAEQRYSLKSSDLSPGMVLDNIATGKREVITEITEDGAVFVRPEDEPTESGGFVGGTKGEVRGYRIAIQKGNPGRIATSQAAGGAAKEPWQMPLEEYRRAFVQQQIKEASARGEAAFVTHYKKGEAGYRLMAEGRREARMRAEAYALELHRDYIQKAIAGGKPVPAEVLRDYPDLAQQAARVMPEAPAGGAAILSNPEAPIPPTGAASEAVDVQTKGKLDPTLVAKWHSATPLEGIGHLCTVGEIITDPKIRQHFSAAQDVEIYVADVVPRGSWGEHHTNIGGKPVIYIDPQATEKTLWEEIIHADRAAKGRPMGEVAEPSAKVGREYFARKEATSMDRIIQGPYLTNWQYGGYSFIEPERDRPEHLWVRGSADYVQPEKVVDLAEKANLKHISLAGGWWELIGYKGYGQSIPTEEVPALLSKAREFAIGIKQPILTDACFVNPTREELEQFRQAVQTCQEQVGYLPKGTKLAPYLRCLGRQAK